MQNETISKFIEQLKNNWQLLAFGVFFFGYLTFAFYMQINGFAFIVPDLTFLSAFGLLMLFISLPIILLSQFGHFNIFLAFFVSSMTPLLFQNFTITLILMILVGFYHSNNLSKFESSGRDESTNKTKEKYIDILMFIGFGIILIFFIDWRYSFLTFINIAFYRIMIEYYEEKKYLNPAHLIGYLLSLSFTIALLINAKGFTLANMQKTEINLQIENNQTIHGSLIFNDDQNFYIRDHNHSISIAKDKVTNIVHYDHQEIKSITLIDILKENIKSFKF
ncbi:MAG: hypothetical protein V2A75_01735 [Pseudomonadota bacterium]